jgi:hypothetical protein
LLKAAGVIAFCLLLNVLQSVLLNTPLFVALAVGTFNVITGVVVPFATEELKSVPDVPNVNAATLVTVPVPIGKSAATKALKTGVPLDPSGAAKTVLAAWLVSVADNVPDVVTGLPVTENMLGSTKPTDVTVPPPPPPLAIHALRYATAKVNSSGKLLALGSTDLVWAIR